MSKVEEKNDKQAGKEEDLPIVACRFFGLGVK